MASFLTPDGTTILGQCDPGIWCDDRDQTWTISEGRCVKLPFTHKYVPLPADYFTRPDLIALRHAHTPS